MAKRGELMAQDLGNGTTRVFGPCAITGDPYECTVPSEGLTRFLNGEHAQVALVGVSADDREFLISGISPKGWTSAFGEG